MVHPSVNIVLLFLIALRSLVVATRLLLWSLPLSTGVGLDWSVLRIIGATAREMTMSTTLETHNDPNRSRVVVRHGSACRGVLMVLLGVGALSRLLILLALLIPLDWALVLILFEVDILPSRTELVSLRGSKAGAVVAGLTLRLILSFHLYAHLLAGILHHDGIVHQLLKALKCMHHQLVFDGCIQSQSKVILLLLILSNICGGITGQLDELIPVLTYRHPSLL